MKKILFYIHNGWVFGKIHNAAIRHLWPDFHADILDWSTMPTPETWAYFVDKYDLIVSLPDVCFMLAAQCNVPLEKLVGVVHAESDIAIAAANHGRAGFRELRGYAVICPWLADVSLQALVPRVPDLLPVGVECALYRRPVADRVQTLGYFSAYERIEDGRDIKRGYLAKQVAEQAGLTFFYRSDVHCFATEALYKRADVVMFCSLNEGNPYVALESIAAGLPVLGTRVGIFPSIASQGAGAILPFAEADFVTEAVEVLQALQTHRKLYVRMHEAALAASEPHDWTNVIPKWKEYFSSLL